VKILKLIASVMVCLGTALAQQNGWQWYGGDIGGMRYSPLTQIDRQNVTQLKPVWIYHTHALEPETDLNHKAAFEATPILFEGTLYLSTPFNQVIALDPVTGAERWKYDPRIDRSESYSEVSSRGVAGWRDPKATPGTPCAARVFEGTIDARLIALDAATGKPCAGFDDNGQIDLSSGVRLKSFGDYQVTSAPVVVGDIVITGSSMGDNRGVELERGIVRGYDARTGKLRWSWEPIPWALKQELRTGAANAWSTISADPERDLIFVPTGSASPDFYGGMRLGDDKWADSVVALRASTGEFVWGFQPTHHDLWDYDIAAQATLFPWGEGKAVIVATKSGMIFLLDELTGKPLNKVEERPVPQSSVPGEQTSPTQAFSSFPALAPQKITVDDAWGITPEERDFCRAKIARYHGGEVFTPPSTEGIIEIPGNVGGVNWSSVAVDASRGLLVTNTVNLPFVVRLIPREKLHEEYMNREQNRMKGEFARQTGTPYGMYREPLQDRDHGLPCSPPPWGTVAAVDLKSEKIKWQVPLGSHVPGQALGSINFGGPMITAGGLVFTAASWDPHLHAFDLETGKLLWEVELPASGQATPMTYSIGGKQYLVISAGGHGKLGSKQGDSVVAYALP